MSDDEERRPSGGVMGVDWGTGNSVAIPPLAVSGSPTPEQIRHFQEEAERYQQSLFEGFRMPAEMFQADAMEASAIDSNGNRVAVEISEEEIRGYAERDSAATISANRHPDTMIVTREQYENEMREAMLHRIRNDIEQDFQDHSLGVLTTSPAPAPPNANSDAYGPSILRGVRRFLQIDHVNKEAPMPTGTSAYAAARIPLPHVEEDDKDTHAADLEQYAEALLAHIKRPLTNAQKLDHVLDTLVCDINRNASELVRVNFDHEEDDALGEENGGKDELLILFQMVVALAQLLGYNDILALKLDSTDKLAMVTGLSEEEEED